MARLFFVRSRSGSPSALLALGLSLLLVLGGRERGARAAPSEAVVDTTRPTRTASTMHPEAGEILRRYVDPEAYGASPENWAAAQDDRGLFYVGNTDGVLIYDGHSWRLEPTANQTSVKSLARSESGRVFVGATNQFGVMRPDSLGRMRYVSLADQLPDAHRSFGDILHVEPAENGVYFMSAERLFHWQPRTDSMRSWGAGEGSFTSLNVVRDTPYVAISDRGLAAVEADTLRDVWEGAPLSDRGITFTMRIPEQGLLVGTRQGLLVRKDGSFRPFPSDPGAAVQKAWTRAAARLPDGTIAVATIRDGIFLFAPDGTLRRHFSARDNPTLGLHVDREGGLWALQYGGMIRYDVGAPVTEHGAATGIQGTPLHIERHRGILHVATSRSFYRLRPGADSVASFESLPAVARTGDEVQCWSLLFDEGQTFVGTTQGLARIGPNDRTEHLTSYPVYDLIRARSDPSRFYAATIQGLRMVRRTTDGWTVDPIRPEFETEIDHIIQEDENTLWAGSDLGVYRFQGIASPDSVTVESFGKQHGLPDGLVWPYRWRGVSVFGTGVAPMRFESSPTARFVPMDNVEQPPGVSESFVYLGGGTPTKTWGLVADVGPGRWILRDSTWRWRPGRLYRFRDRDVFMAHVEGDGDVVWFGTRDGSVLRYVPDRGVSRPPAPPRVRTVRTLGPDSTVTADGSSAAAATLPFARNSLRITYGTPSLVAPEKIEYQYRLGGQTAGWSDWTGRTEQSFRALETGTYTFAVRARLAYGDTTRTARYAFTVLPPWYRTWWAYGLYLLAALGVIAGVVRWRTRQLRRRQEKLERAVTERTEAIEQQKQQLADQAEKLKALDEAKTRFFANVSHEFRTPLTLILGPARDLRDRVQRHLSNEDAEQVGVIERNARRLLRLVDQILGIARMEAGTYQLNARPTAAGDEAERIVRALEPMAERKGLSLTLETSDGGAPSDTRPPLYVDREALEHILSNLISNAIKFTPEGGAVTVRVSARDDEVAVAVSDTGPGIPEAEQDAIFDRFQQSPQSPGRATREQKGVGIGLAFVQDLVELHGGTIEVDSAEGEGATFVVRFPRGTEHLADEHVDDSATPADTPEEPVGPVADGLPERPPAPSDDAPSSETKVVLVVDDNADVRRYIRSVLEPDFAVLEATDGTEGVERAREALPDVILADVMMPNVDGHEMTRRLKDDPETEAIPVIMVTARAGTEDEVEGLKVGADDYVTKPFDADVLQQRVEGVLALQERLRDHLREVLSEEEASAPDDTASEVERAARAQIREHLTDSSFGVDELAEAMALSRSSLYRRFNEETDTTPSALITEVRMEQARELLRDGEPVTQVAYAVGYEQLASFSRAFRSYAGHPPSAVPSGAA